MKKENKTIKYILQGFHEDKWKILEKSITIEKLGKKIAINITFDKDWYIDENNNKIKLKVKAVEMKGNKIIRELEEYKLTKDWKIYGYLKNW